MSKSIGGGWRGQGCLGLTIWSGYQPGSDKTYGFSGTSFPCTIRCVSPCHADCAVEPTFPAHIGKRAQDLEEPCRDAAQCFWSTAEHFEANYLFAPAKHP